jgi:RNA polymerase sigma factor (sigma-70 family)
MNAQDPDIETTRPSPSAPALQAAPLRPLSNGRYRTDEVESQIRWLLSLSFGEARRLMTDRDGGAQPLIKEETLVYLLREYTRRGLAREAGVIAVELLQRAAPKIARWVKFGLPSGSPAHCEQCLEEIQTQMFVALQSESSGCEFWEIGFWLCLKRRARNCLEQFRRVTANEVNPTVYTNDNNDETNMLDTIADQTIANIQSRMEMQEALSRLNSDQRKVIVLLYTERWTQQEIASHFGVSDRTIRNWITAALKCLRDYYGVSCK